MKKLPIVLQSELHECGQACIVMLAAFHGYIVDLPYMRSRFATSIKGTSLHRLIAMLRELRFTTKAYAASAESLSSVRLPCILFWRSNHFVVLKEIRGEKYVLHDPALGKVVLERMEFGEEYSGVALEAVPAQEFEKADLRTKFGLKSAFPHISRFRGQLASALFLALIAEGLAILVPRQIQWAVDHFVTAGRGEIWLVTMAFAAIVALQAILLGVKSWMLARVGTELNLEWYHKLLSHVLRLPSSFYGSRHVGDVAAKFQSLRVIQNAITKGSVEGALSGIFGLLALGALSLYSIQLAGIVCTVAFLYCLTRWILVSRVIEISRSEIAWTAITQGELIETVGGIESIYVGNQQSRCASRNLRSLRKALEFSLQGARLSGTITPFGQGVFSLSRVLIITYAILLARDRALTSGMMVACVSYADIFFAKTSMLMEKVFELKQMRPHFEGIAEYALAARQDMGSEEQYNIEQLTPNVTVRNLSFRYSQSDPWIFRNLNIEITAGESVAIVGDSGAGKSTLAKLILGLIQPTEGEILIGGVSLAKIGLVNVRTMCSTVLQDDCLFSGSIAENISWFDKSIDEGAMHLAAKAASIHDEIMSMPMKYQTKVSGRGGGLSGGQRQRVMLARALYKAPRIILLDEATSHLDAGNESRINSAIGALQITRIILAHRQETIRSAGRVIRLADAQPLHEGEVLVA